MDIAQLFQQFLGRAPRGDEQSYFQGLIDKGQISPYEISYFLQGLPEYQQKQAATSREQAMGAAREYDIAMFPQYRQQMMGQFAQMGRPDTSGYDMAMGKMQRDIALERGQQFAGMTREDELRAMGYGQQMGMGAMQQQYGQQTATTDYERRLEMQRRQFDQDRSMWELKKRYMQESQPSFMESLVPGLISGAASIYGAKLGAPQTNIY